MNLLTGLLASGLTLFPGGVNETFYATAGDLSPLPIVVAQTPPVVTTHVVSSRSPANPQRVQATVGSASGLTGSIGYAKAGGNCVNQIPKSIRPNGNPITWTVTSRTPRIGAIALWNYNHTGLVVGIWGNGDVEVAHENYRGGQTRFHPSEFRGFR